MKTKLIILLFFITGPYFLKAQTVDRLWYPHTGFLMFLSIYDIDVGLKENERYLSHYQQRFDKQEYNRCRNNEFEWKPYCDRTIASVNNQVRQINFDTTYTFYSDCNFGVYNLQTESFPILRNGNNNEFYMSTIFQPLPRFVHINAGTYLLDPINEFEFYNLEMEKVTAQYFVQQRTSNSGAVNRKIYTRARLKIIPQKNLSTEKSYWTVLAHILSVDYFSDRKYENLLQTKHSSIEWQSHILIRPTGRWINESNSEDTLLIIKYNDVKTPYLLNASSYQSQLYQLSPARFDLKINHKFELLIISADRIMIQTNEERKIYRRRV
ncbi:MAG: DUF4852 domain-containing protein [Bacteroidetes bacterium]|nr:DUF4852 domain-containing protein [Bacteroidota bacterium]